jgi:probable HAF family extracellular repeat protein
MRRDMVAPLVLTVVLGGSVRAFAAEQYSLTRIPADPFEGIGAFGLNESGLVVGWRGNYGESAPRWSGYVWRSGGMTDLGVGPAAFDVNDAGQVVGRDEDAAHNYHAFTWTASTGVRRLGELPGGAVFAAAPFSEAVAVNNAGQIVGHLNDAGGNRAFVREPNGSLRFLPVPQGAPPQDVLAFGMNDAGDVVGRVYQGNSSYHACLWPAAGGSRDLGDLPGGLEFGNAVKINNGGLILGVAHADPDPANPISSGERAVLFLADGTIRQLGLLPGMTESNGRDINDQGDVVGFSGRGGTWSDSHAFVWSEQAGMRDINGLLDASGTGWSLSLPQAINNAGQILVVGQFQGREALALLTPVPEVTAATLAVTIAPFALLTRRRRRAAAHDARSGGGPDRSS